MPRVGRESSLAVNSVHKTAAQESIVSQLRLRAMPVLGLRTCGPLSSGLQRHDLALGKRGPKTHIFSAERSAKTPPMPGPTRREWTSRWWASPSTMMSSLDPRLGIHPKFELAAPSEEGVGSPRHLS